MHHITQSVIDRLNFKVTYFTDQEKEKIAQCIDDEIANHLISVDDIDNDILDGINESRGRFSIGKYWFLIMLASDLVVYIIFRQFLCR